MASLSTQEHSPTGRYCGCCGHALKTDGKCNENPLYTRGYLSIKEAAEWAGVSKETIERWMERGLPFLSGRGKREDSDSPG